MGTSLLSIADIFCLSIQEWLAQWNGWFENHIGYQKNVYYSPEYNDSCVKIMFSITSDMTGNNEIGL